jgi:hypothetical protein
MLQEFNEPFDVSKVLFERRHSNAAEHWQPGE